MAKVLKYIGIFIGIVLLLAILALVCFVTFVDPNRFKPYIADQVMKKTGRQLTIDGNLSWSFFPYLGVNIEHVTLNNPPAFKQTTFAEVDHATIQVAVMPLWHGRVESKGIVLEGIKLYLIKHANGQNNWTFTPITASSAQAQKKIDSATATPKTAFASLALAISDVTISDLDLMWRDESTQNFADIHGLSFHAQNLQFDHAFPCTLDFHFDVKNPAISGSVSGKTNMQLDVSHSTYALRDIHFTTYLTQGVKRETIQTAGDLEWQNQHAILHGVIEMDSVPLGSVSLQDVRIPIDMKNNIVTFNPVTSTFYHGQLNTNAVLNLQTSIPQVAIKGRLTNVQVEPLVKDLNGANRKLAMSGVGHISFDVTTAGQGAAAMTQNLNGTAAVRVEQGALKGIDIAYFLSQAQSFLKKQPAALQNTGETPFGALTGSLVMRQGVLSNSDLKLESPLFQTLGKGQIDLPKQSIHYSLQTRVTSANEHEKNLSNLYGISIPIVVKGSLSNPSIQLDMTALTMAIGQQQLHKTETQVIEKVKEKSPKAAEFLQHLLGQ